ncbi:hypothetical protein BDR07DRAFT_1431483 [Suillus spraguei]|nr:hypothetical protein BDR07DRAFT_1431483 [Suillus spraguei]
MQWEGHGIATKIRAARTENSSEAASFNGYVSFGPSTYSPHIVYRHKALTPMIAGSVCGGVLVIAWTIGLVLYLLKRRKSKERNPKERNEVEQYIIPPDPAILQEDRNLNEHSTRISV